MRIIGWIAVGAVAVSLGLPCPAQTAAAPESVHILVQARTLAGDPIDGLRAQDFKVSSARKVLPVLSVQSPRSQTVAVSQEPAHALLMISVYSDYASENAIVDLLRRNLPADFGDVRLAVCQRNGRITDYVGSLAELTQQITGFRMRRELFDDALNDLGTYPGQRSLLYFTERGVDIPPPLRHKAEQVAALTYQVGGSKWKNYVVRSESGPSGPPSYSMGDNLIYGRVDQGGVGILAPGEPPPILLTKSIREVYVVRSLQEAYRDLAAMGRGYYDVTVGVPAVTRVLDLELDVRHDYQLTAQSYAAGKQTRQPFICLRYKFRARRPGKRSNRFSEILRV